MKEFQMKSLKAYINLGAMTALALTAFVTGPAFVAAAPPASKPTLSTPSISCPVEADDNTIALKLCAGVTGAPAGFSVQWITCDALANGPDGIPDTLDDNTWPASESDALCKASFSGNANGTSWSLGSNACTNVLIGELNDADPGVSFNCNDPLACESCYAFRAFAHANSANFRSAFTTALECTTGDCEPTGFEPGAFCTRSQGFYGGNGAAGRDTLVACYGGDPTGAACTSVGNNPLVTLGGGTFTYDWKTTGTCTDVQSGPNVFLLDRGIIALNSAIGGGGSSGFFTTSKTNSISMDSGGGLASQTAALSLNIALSGQSCSANSSFPTGFPAGYGNVVLCNFQEGDTFTNSGTPISAATAAALNGQTVSQVLAAANAYLGNGGTVPYVLGSAGVLNELISNLNLAFDGTDWDGNGVDDHECGGMSAFAENHMCSAP
jgi:hypothetical protein